MRVSPYPAMEVLSMEVDMEMLNMEVDMDNTRAWRKYQHTKRRIAPPLIGPPLYLPKWEGRGLPEWEWAKGHHRGALADPRSGGAKTQSREESEDCDIAPLYLPEGEGRGLPKWEWANGHYRGGQAGDNATSQSNKYKGDIYYRHYGHRDIKVFQFNNDNICYSDYRLKIRKNRVYFTDPMRSRRDPDEPRASAALRRLKPRVMQTERKRKPKKRGIRNPERKGDRRKKLAEQLKLRRKRNKEKPTTPCTDLGEPVQGNIFVFVSRTALSKRQQTSEQRRNWADNSEKWKAK